MTVSSADDQNLSKTTAVGVYPHRVSPNAVMDMAGNLWEWCCLNKYDSPEEIGVDVSGDRRVVRGGSWYYGPGSARCAYRRRGSPGSRSGDIGFRVVCLSPFTDH